MIRLSREDVSLMLDNLELSNHLIQLLKTKRGGGIVCDAVADELRDLCNDRLDAHGFDANYEITDEGQKLEKLIDKLYVG